MNFTQAIQTCFQKYITIEGRAQRSEFWWWVLFTIIASIVIAPLDAAILSASKQGWFRSPWYPLFSWDIDSRYYRDSAPFA